jgi:hypothetical protein
VVTFELDILKISDPAAPPYVKENAEENPEICNDVTGTELDGVRACPFGVL